MFWNEKICIISAKKKINNGDRAKNEKIAKMTYTINENFNIHYCFVLTIALKIVDQKNKIFIVDNTVNEKINKIIVDNKTTSAKNFVIIFDATSEKKTTLLISLL